MVRIRKLSCGVPYEAQDSQGCRTNILPCPCVHRTISTQVRNTVHEHYQQPSEFHHSLLEAYHILMALPPQRIAFLRRRLRGEEERHAAILALLIRARQDRRRPARRRWVKPWIERRQLFGQYPGAGERVRV